MTARTLAAFAALIATFVPGLVRGEEALGVLAVADAPGPDASLASAAERLRAALAARLPGVLGQVELRERMTGTAAPSSVAELRRAHAGAIASYAAGDFDGSVKTLRAVAEALEALPPGPEPFAEWSAAMLRLARTEQEVGRRVEAQAVIERLLRAAPDTRPDARRYPPSFVALVEESRERLRALGTRRLAVDAEPGVRVFVEGREAGTAPVVVQVAPGRYRVVGERGGVRTAPEVADTSAEDRTVALDLSLAEALRPDAGPGLALPEAERAARVVAMAARLRLDRAVTAAVLRDGAAPLLVATVHDVRRGRVEREGRIRLEGGAPAPEAVEALAAFLATGRTSALVSTAGGPTLSLQAAPPPLAAPRDTLVQGAAPASHGLRWAAAISGAVTLAASAVAVYHGAAASDRYSEARGMLDGAGRVRPGLSTVDYNRRIRDGDERRAVATGAAVTAGVGLVATTVLAYLGFRQDAGATRF